MRPAAQAVAIARAYLLLALRLPDGVRCGLARLRSLSADKARVLEEVNRLLAQFGLDDLKVVIAREPVVVGGQPFIRAMAGTFRTADEARARCVAVKGVDARRWCEPLALLSSEYPCET